MCLAKLEIESGAGQHEYFINENSLGVKSVKYKYAIVYMCGFRGDYWVSHFSNTKKYLNKILYETKNGFICEIVKKIK